MEINFPSCYLVKGKRAREPLGVVPIHLILSNEDTSLLMKKKKKKKIKEDKSLDNCLMFVSRPESRGLWNLCRDHVLPSNTCQIPVNCGLVPLIKVYSRSPTDNNINKVQ